MLFNSLHFLIFFPIVVALYFLLPHKIRWILLLAASYYFYMAWKPEYAILMLFSTAVDYVAGLAMGKEEDKKKRKRILYFSFIANLGLLFTFKYFNFFNDSARELLNYFNIFYNAPSFKLLLPVGISFYTFQSLSYTIDVYRGVVKPEKHFGIFALYVSFFPQLVAGPIERTQHLLPQFFEKHTFSYERAAEGLGLMLWGFFKKIVIADNAAALVNIVYNNPESFYGIHFIIATVLFAFQILCDFSGYSDIAIGTAKIMGFDIMKNFKRPYLAQTIADFWRRWHISLSTWFRDYLYIPLGGNRVAPWRANANLMITFVVSGLWHGANWTFVIWGFLHGIYIVLGKTTQAWRDAFKKRLRINTTSFLHMVWQTTWVFVLVCFSWIFFRANSLRDALYIISHLFEGTGLFMRNIMDIGYVKSVLSVFGVSPVSFVMLWVFIIFLMLVYSFKKDETVRTTLRAKPTWVRWSFYYLLIFFILFFGNFGEQPFIYFQF